MSEHRQLDEAARILSAHGIDAKRYDEVKRERLKLWTAEARAALNDDAPEPDADAVWLRGSVLQLQRNWSGRCISCVHWTPDPAVNTGGACVQLVAPETDALIAVKVKDTPHTAPAFGCILWGEIPPTETGELTNRAELAITLGLLPVKPEGE